MDQSDDHETYRERFQESIIREITIESDDDSEKKKPIDEDSHCKLADKEVLKACSQEGDSTKDRLDVSY